MGEKDNDSVGMPRSSAVSRKVASFSSPLSEGGFRGVLRSPKNLPQPLLEKEGGKKSNDLLGNGTSYESGKPTIRRAVDRLTRVSVSLLCATMATAALGSPLDTPEDKTKSDERKLSRRLIRGTTADDEDIMEKIIRMMDQTARRLEVDFDAGEETQALQLEVLEQLDDAIKLAAAQTRKSSGQQRSSESDRRRRQEKDKSRNAEPNPNKGESANTAPAGRRPTAGGIHDRDDLAESRRGWGNLPQRERDEVIQGAGERYLERYRKWIEQYYRALQEAGE